MVAIILVAWLLYTLFTSGIVNTANIDKGMEIQLTQSDGKVINIKPGIRIIPAGTYLATMKNDNSRAVYKQTITVNNLLRLTDLNISKKPQAATKVLQNTKSINFLNYDDNLFSYKQNGNVIYDDLSPQNPPYLDTCETYCTNLIPYEENVLLGYSTAEESGQVIVKSISVTNKEIQPINNRSIYPAGSTIYTNTKDGSFAIYDGDKTIYHYTSLEAQPTTIKIDNKIASGVDDLLIAVTQANTLVVQGNNFIAMSGNSDKAPPKKVNYNVVMYSNKNGKQVSSQNFNNISLIADISLSPDGSYFTLNTADGFKLYKTGEDKVLLYEPQATAISIQVEWINNESYAYLNGIDGIYLGSVNGSSYPLFSSKNINMSSFSYIGDKLHVSGFYTSFTDTMPIAMLVDPSKPEVNNSLIQRNLLTKTYNYSIGFDGEIFTIYRAYDYINMTTIKGDLTPAYDYIKKLAKDPKIIVAE